MGWGGRSGVRLFGMGEEELGGGGDSRKAKKREGPEGEGKGRPEEK